VLPPHLVVLRLIATGGVGGLVSGLILAVTFVLVERVHAEWLQIVLMQVFGACVACALLLLCEHVVIRLRVKVPFLSAPFLGVPALAIGAPLATFAMVSGLVWFTLLFSQGPEAAFAGVARVLRAPAESPTEVLLIVVPPVLPFALLGAVRTGSIPPVYGRPSPLWLELAAATLGGLLCYTVFMELKDRQWWTTHPLRLLVFMLPMVAAPLGFRLGEWLESRLLERLRSR
jgi:hypothetical protein